MRCPRPLCVPSALLLSFGLCVAITTASPSAWATATDTASGNAPQAESEDAELSPASDGVQPVAAPSASAKAQEDTSHKGQFNVRLAGVAAYRIVMRYDESPRCAGVETTGEPRKFCGFGAPLGLDTAIGYGVLSSVEPFVWARFGLTNENTTHTAPLLVLGAGVRLYSMSDAPFKFFIEPAIGAELEGRASGATDATGPSSAYKQDFLVRLAVGPQYDFSRYVGVYAAGAMSVGVMRALHSFMELHGGVQARFP